MSKTGIYVGMMEDLYVVRNSDEVFLIKNVCYTKNGNEIPDHRLIENETRVSTESCILVLQVDSILTLANTLKENKAYA